MSFVKIKEKVNKPFWKNAYLLSLILLTLIFPNIFYLTHTNAPSLLILKYSAIALLFLLNPIVFFYKNIKIYLYALSFFALFVPMVCFSIYLFDLKFGARLANLVFQTNFEETKEITQGYRTIFIVVTALYTAIYIFLVKKTTVKAISLRLALFLSIISISIVWGKMFQLKKDFKVTSMYGILDEYYPMSVISGTMQALLTAPNNLNEARDFSFHAFKEDSLPTRQIYVLVIGESSRYDHWQINGYNRQTSPLLSNLHNLITFPHMAAGAHFTWLSVPQMITRATPANMEIQYQEKGIMSAFKDAGFKTIWLSNQDPDYYTGSFTLHAETSDLCLFPGATQLNAKDPYDERYLGVIDSLIQESSKNLFIIFHTMGSHWDYSKRYPAKFDFFRPSGTSVSINPPNSSKKEEIVNSYDNTIRYTDYIIDSVIQIIRKYNAISYVTYVSDHGEDLFDLNKTQLNFHLSASRNTLHVPYFIWTSNEYNTTYKWKRQNLLKNKNRRLGENDIFYTLLNMSNISFPQFDSTNSISSSAFHDSKQEYIEQGASGIHYYSKLAN